MIGDAREEGAHEVVGVDAERLEVLVLPHQNLLKNNKKRITSLTLVICLMIYYPLLQLLQARGYFGHSSRYSAP